MPIYILEAETVLGVLYRVTLGSSPRTCFAQVKPLKAFFTHLCHTNFAPRWFHLETHLASRWEGVRLPRASGKCTDFPESSPNFPGSFSATSPEVLSLWNLTATQRFPRSFPNFPGSSPNLPGSSQTSLEVSPFLWEARHPLLTHKNFL